MPTLEREDFDNGTALLTILVKHAEYAKKLKRELVTQQTTS